MGLKVSPCSGEACGFGGPFVWDPQRRGRPVSAHAQASLARTVWRWIPVATPAFCLVCCLYPVLLHTSHPPSFLLPAPMPARLRAAFWFPPQNKSFQPNDREFPLLPRSSPFPSFLSRFLGQAFLLCAHPTIVMGRHWPCPEAGFGNPEGGRPRGPSLLSLAECPRSLLPSCPWGSQPLHPWIQPQLSNPTLRISASPSGLPYARSPFCDLVNFRSPCVQAGAGLSQLPHCGDAMN